MKRFLILLYSMLAILASADAATKILGTPQASVDRMYQFVKSKNPGSSFTREIAEQFYTQGVRWGIRGDIALCQSCIETGWFRYTGGTAVTPDDHNYCGLGVTQLGKKGCQFATVAEGVSAQLQHLWAYATTASLPSGWTLVDPRFNYVNRGCAPYWENLGSGKWASAVGYGADIISIYNEMTNFSVANPSLKADMASIEFAVTQGSASPTKSVNITGQNLSSAIIFNSSSSVFSVTTSNWNDYTGGTLIITLDTSRNPGTYSGYIAVQSGSGDDKQRIEIKCAATIKAAAEAPSIAIEPNEISLTAKQGEVSPSRDVTVSAKNLTTDMTYTSNSSAIIVQPGNDWNPRSGGTLTITLDTSKGAGSYNGYVAVQTSSSTRATVNVNGTILKKDGTDSTTLDFKEIWNHSETSGDKDWETSVRNFDYADGKLYCVHNNSSIKIIDARTGSELGTLSTNGVTGGVITLCDVRVHEGRVYASNIGNSSSPLKVYVWETDSSDPTLLLSTTDMQNATRLGDCIDVYGTYPSDLWLTFANDNSTATRIVQFNLRNGIWTTKALNATTDGSKSLASGVSTRVRFSPLGFWIDGKNIQPTFLNTNGVKQYSLSATDCTHGNDFATFTFEKSNYILSTNYLNKAASTYSDGIMRLYDISAGWNSPIAKADFPANGLGTTRNTNTTGSLRVNVTGTTVEAWILTTAQGMAYYRSGELDDDTGGDSETDVPLPTSFTTDWCYSAANGTSATFMDPSNDYTRNMTMNGDKLYIVQRNASDADIAIVNAHSGSKTGTLPSTGLSASNWKYSSVANLGGTIVACNLAFGATSSLKAYAWSNDNATPSIILETTDHGARSGDLMTAYGTINNGKLYFTSNTGYEGKIYVYTVTNGSASPTPEIITLKNASGATYDLGGGFAVIEARGQKDGSIVATGKNGSTAIFSSDGTLIKELNKSAVGGNTLGTSYFPFRHGKHDLAATISYRNGVQQGYLNLVDVTEGMDSPKIINSYASLGAAGVSNSTFVTTAIAKSEGNKIHLWALIPKQGIAKYTAMSSTTSTETINSDISAIELRYNGLEVYTTNGETTRLRIIGMTGIIVAEAIDHKLSTTGLPQGIYIAVATLADGSTKTIKISVR